MMALCCTSRGPLCKTSGGGTEVGNLSVGT